MKVKVLVTQLCPTVFDPIDCSPPGSCVHGILQERILEWVAIPFSRGSSQPRDWTPVSCIAGRFFTVWDTREACVCVCLHACMLSCFSHVRLFATQWTLWTVACKAPLAMGSSRQEYWSGLPCPPPRDLPKESNLCLLWLLHCRRIFYLSATGEAPYICVYIYVSTCIHTHIYTHIYVYWTITQP